MRCRAAARYVYPFCISTLCSFSEEEGTEIPPSEDLVTTRGPAVAVSR